MPPHTQGPSSCLENTRIDKKEKYIDTVDIELWDQKSVLEIVRSYHKRSTILVSKYSAVLDTGNQSVKLKKSTKQDAKKSVINDPKRSTVQVLK